MSLDLQVADWLSMFSHFLMLSLLSIGGAITTTPEMHRFLVDEHGWLTDAQFNASIAIGQAAPGPNVLFVALMGWMVGINNGSMWWGLLGVLVTMAGIIIPSATLNYNAAQWGHRNRTRRSVRAFKQGMAPITIAVLIATGWIMASAHKVPSRDWPLWTLTLGSALLVWKTRIPLLWLLGVGGVVGWVLFG